MPSVAHLQLLPDCQPASLPARSAPTRMLLQRTCNDLWGSGMPCCCWRLRRCCCCGAGAAPRRKAAAEPPTRRVA